MANELGAGYKSLAGIGLESLSGTYPTLVAPTIKIPIVNESVNQIVEFLEDNALHGKRGYESPTIIGKKTSGAIRIQASYRTSEFLIFAALGGADVKGGGAAPYSHNISIGDDILRYFSLIIEKDVNVWNIAGAKITKLTLVSSREGVYWDMELIASVITRADTHRAALVALSYDESNVRMFHHQLAFQFADCDNALDANDKIKCSEFSLEIDNKLIGDDQDCISGIYIDNPRRGGKAEVSLSLTVPRYVDDSFVDWKDAGTKLQAIIDYTGGTLGEGTFGCKIEIPTIYLKALPLPVADDSKIPQNITASCYRNDGNTHISTVAEEFEITLKNSNAAEYAWEV